MPTKTYHELWTSTLTAVSAVGGNWVVKDSSVFFTSSLLSSASSSNGFSVDCWDSLETDLAALLK